MCVSKSVYCISDFGMGGLLQILGEQFRFTSTLKEDADFPYIPACTLCMFSCAINIPHKIGPFATLVSLTMTQHAFTMPTACVGP